MLSSSPVLIPPDLNKEFFLWCDACEDGFGVILEQIGEDGLRHSVAYASRATNEAERKYPPTKLEMASIIYALNHFEVYLLGHKITVYTDHQALVSGYISYLKGQTKGLLSRWHLKISQYLPHLMIEYKPGKSNEAADALSRAPAYTEEKSEHSDEIGMVLQITVSSYPEEALLQSIQTQQSEDREIVDIINYLEKKILPTDSKEAKHMVAIAKKGYFVLDGILYYESSEVTGRRRLVIPQQLRDKVVSENHDAIFSGQFSAKKMLKQYFYWPGMSSMVFKKCESCLTCATTQGQERRQNPELHSIPVGEPFACIGMDFKEMDESCDKNRFALVFQDYLSKWPEVYAVADRTAQTVAKCLADVIYRHGVPSTIIHDRAPEFLSDVLQDTAFILGIKQLPTSPSHPQCDGLVETFNRTLKLMLSKLVENKGRDWDRLLGPVLFSYRTTPHSSKNETPFFLLHGSCHQL